MQCLCAPFSRFRTAESSVFINRTRLFSHFINKVSIRYPNPNARHNRWDRRVGGARLNVVTTRMGNNYVLLLGIAPTPRCWVLCRIYKGPSDETINRSPVCCILLLYHYQLQYHNVFQGSWHCHSKNLLVFRTDLHNGKVKAGSPKNKNEHQFQSCLNHLLNVLQLF